jgi:hypothetical protein
MATTDTVEASGLPEDNRNEDTERVGRYWLYALAAVISFPIMTIVGAVMWANGKKAGKGVVLWSLFGIAMWSLVAIGFAAAASTGDSIANSGFAAPVASPTATTLPANTGTVANTPATVANPSTGIDTSTCSVAPATGLTDTKAVTLQLLQMRAAGLSTRNQDCLEHFWAGKDRAAVDLQKAAYACSNTAIISITGAAQAVSGQPVNVTYQSCSDTFSATATLVKVGNEWRMASLVG